MIISILTIIYIINAIVAVITVLVKPRDVAAIWAWLLVLISIPVFGFALYLFFGRGLGDEQTFRLEQGDVEELKKFQEFQESDGITYGEALPEHIDSGYLTFFTSLNNMPLTNQNKVEIITDGVEKFERLKADLKKATHSIHFEYYAFIPDEVGRSILTILEERAAAGVEVRFLYDAYGSLGTKSSDFNELRRLGGQAQTFITSQRALLKFRLNYHVHRKIVVIDGQISYIGGFNISNQYAQVTKKYGYWRDTHLRIHGPASSLMQIRFLMDWNVSVSQVQKLDYQQEYFFDSDGLDPSGATPIQLIASGPNNEREQIKLAFIKLITSAKKRVWIQSPYLVPDDSVLAALRIAAHSGVDVKIMIPNKPDHPFIYRATQYYARQLIKENVEIQVYDGGFMHAKTLIMDDDICIVGSANQDIRSYKLNFEASAVLYDQEVVAELAATFIKDMAVSTEFTAETVKNMSVWLLFKQQISRLFSPIL